MGSESTSDMAAKEQAWNVLEEILGLLDQSKVYTISCGYNRLRVHVIFFSSLAPKPILSFSMLHLGMSLEFLLYYIYYDHWDFYYKERSSFQEGFTEYYISILQEIFPEMEVLWFLAKAWNCGIHLYR